MQLANQKEKKGKVVGSELTRFMNNFPKKKKKYQSNWFTIIRWSKIDLFY